MNEEMKFISFMKEKPEHDKISTEMYMLIYLFVDLLIYFILFIYLFCVLRHIRENIFFFHLYMTASTIVGRHSTEPGAKPTCLYVQDVLKHHDFMLCRVYILVHVFCLQF